MQTVSNETKKLITALFEKNLIQLGEFTFKSGIQSPIYCDLRSIISEPEILHLVCNQILQKCKILDFDYICGVPYGAISFAAITAHNLKKPMIIKRKENKDYGLNKLIEGKFETNKKCLLIEDVASTGGSCNETTSVLQERGLHVKDIIVIMAYPKGQRQLTQQGFNVHSLFTFEEIITVFDHSSAITLATKQRLKTFAQTTIA